MCAMKRVSTTSGGRPSKARKVDLVKAKVDKVQSAIRASKELPTSVVSMITSMSAPALGTYKADRHKFQVSMVEMVGEALRGLEAAMKRSIVEKESSSSQASATKASRMEHKEAMDASLESKKEAVVGRQAEVATSKAALKDMTTCLKDAESEAKVKAAKVKVATDKKTRLEEFRTGTLLPLKDGTPEGETLNLKKAGKDVAAIGKEFKMERMLVETVAVALRLKSGARGAFQEIALTQMADVLAKLIASYGEIVWQWTNEPLQHNTSVESAKEKERTSKESLEVCENALSAAKRDVVDAKKALVAAETAVENYWSDMKSLMDGLDKAKKGLTELQEGALVAFAELENLEPPPEVPVAEESVSAGDVALSAGAEALTVTPSA